MTIGRFIDQLARIVTNPASNLTGAVLLLAMVVLVLLILAVAALITILPGREEQDGGDEVPAAAKERQERPKEKRASGARAAPKWSRIFRGGERDTLLLSVLPVALVLAGLVWGWYVTSDPQRCASCHATAASEATWRSSDHRRVGCVTCHEDGGIGFASAAAYRVGDAIAAVRGVETTGNIRPVPPYRCLRCHRDIAKGIVRSGAIRVSHRAFLDKGYACARCHRSVGHTRSEAPERAVDMNQCVTCHDGKTASASCATCHIGDPSAAVRVDRSLFMKVDITPPPGCTGCHETATCLACHQTVMPHPAGFETGKGHARLAVFERKGQVCYRCHVAQDCKRCHKGDFTTHGAGWKAGHPSGVPLDGRNACACHSTPNFCGLCHQTSARR